MPCNEVPRDYLESTHVTLSGGGASMQTKAHSTDHVAAPERASHWNAVIAEAYFPLQLTFRDAGAFQGRLEKGSVGAVSLSRLQTQPLRYERNLRHIAGTTEEEYLITIPRRAPVDFRQLGRDVRCDPGGFIIERGDEPYRFSYEAPNDLYVLKVARPVLAEKIRSPDRHCAQVFDGRGGMGALFVSMAQQVQAQRDVDPRSAEVLGRQLIELLALAVDGQAGGGEGVRSAVREAHLRRAEGVIRRSLADPALSPDMVAEACGISKRYLHELFAEANSTVSQHIRDQRLIAARDLLQMPGTMPMSDIAYRFGFSDQAQFSRLFKAKFGQTPSGYRQQHAARGV